MMHPDDEPGFPATEAQADREEAYALGAMHPERAWINTDRDAWHANPFYKGPPVPHPESDPDTWPDLKMRHAEAETGAAQRTFMGFPILVDPHMPKKEPFTWRRARQHPGLGLTGMMTFPSRRNRLRPV